MELARYLMSCVDYSILQIDMQDKGLSINWDSMCFVAEDYSPAPEDHWTKQLSKYVNETFGTHVKKATTNNFKQGVCSRIKDSGLAEHRISIDFVENRPERKGKPSTVSLVVTDHPRNKPAQYYTFQTDTNGKKEAVEFYLQKAAELYEEFSPENLAREYEQRKAAIEKLYGKPKS